METLDPEDRDSNSAECFAYNPGQRLRVWFSGTGIELEGGRESTAGTPAWKIGFCLTGIGRDSNFTPAASGTIASDGNRVEIRRVAHFITEWFENRPEGLEHGFTLHQGNGAAAETRLLLETTAGRLGAVENSGDAIRVLNPEGSEVLAYSGLKAWDADGTALDARMERVSPTTLALVVNVAGARYPVTVDPLFANVEARLVEESVAYDAFGSAVAFDGVTAVVGAPNDDSAAGFDTGCAYVFRLDGELWALEAKLTGGDSATDDRFGSAVAVAGNTVVVGCHLDDTGVGYDAGSVHVFTREGPLWTRQAKLVPTDAAGYDYFGCAVAVAGERIMAGARGDAKSAGYDAGSAYVFSRSGTIWSQEVKLTASDAAPEDRFGAAVALTDTTALIGAWGADTAAGANAGGAYVFVHSGTSWTQQAKLTAPGTAAGDNLGNAVALSGDTALVGAWGHDLSGMTDSGAAHVFIRAGSNWNHQAKLTASDAAAGDYFGASVAVVGDLAMIGAWGGDSAAGLDCGSAYLFSRSGGAWTQHPKLAAADAAASDRFGSAVALAGSTALIGARGDTTPAGINAGASYVFTEVAGIWTERHKLLANDGPQGDKGGMAVAVDGDTAVIGAPDDATAAGLAAGTSYVFVRYGSGWLQQAKLTPADGAAGDRFGAAVAIAGDTLVAGAPGDDGNVGMDAGSVYLFVRGGGIWGLQTKLTDPDAASSDGFGNAVAITGETVAVGAPSADGAAGANTGSVTVFFHNAGSWNRQGKLIADDAVADDRMGISVAAYGDMILAGADGCDTSAGMNAGGAYLFNRVGSTWSQQAKLTAPDGSALDRFGSAVALGSDTALVGAWADDTAAGADAGSAYVFMRSGSQWIAQGKLTAADASASDSFGSSVGLSCDIAVIGAPFDATPSGLGAGGAYVFQRSGGAWCQQVKLTAGLDASTYDFFGASVAVSGNSVVVGAPYEDNIGTDAGCAYLFVLGELPGIVQQPQSQVVISGQSVGFSVVANGAPPLRFQWRRNGFEIPGATTTSHSIAAAQVADQGYYDCVVSNPGGVVTSAAARLTVNDLCRFDRLFPAASGESSGFAIINLAPPGIGGWRFTGERQWRPSGVPVGGLASGDRLIEFLPVPGFIQPLAEILTVTSGSPATGIDRTYYETTAPDTGSLSVILKPESLAAATVPQTVRAQWRIFGEDDSQWCDSGANRSGMAVGTHLIECKPVTGRVAPQAALVAITKDVTALVTLTYTSATSDTGTQPTPLPYESVAEDDSLPYGFIGQLRGKSGLASGFVVRPRVAATAGHVVFDDGTLSAVTDLQWLCQRHRGVHEPVPQVPRGFYLFDSYAALRAAENTPGTSSPASQNLDAAALYFMENADRGGYSGYLASDQDENEFIVSEADKILAGYPVDGIPATSQGRIHATSPSPVPFTRSLGRTFVTVEIRGTGGMSGGPLCVQHANGHYYPTAIYLGGSGQTVVRAIDSQVIDLFNRAELSGNGGTNNTGGGISHTSVTGTLNTTQPGSLKVIIEPAAARTEGAGWRLKPETTNRLSGAQKSGLNPGSYTLEFTPVSGFPAPTEQLVIVTGGQLMTLTFTYGETLTALESWRLTNFGIATNTDNAADDKDPDGDGQPNLSEYAAGTNPNNASDVFKVLTSQKSGSTFTVTAAGKAGRTYAVQRRADLASGTWITLNSLGPLATNGPVSLTDPAAPAGMAFYRIQVLLP